MQTFGTVMGVVLCIGLCAYIGVSLFRLIRDIIDKRRLKDEPDNGESLQKDETNPDN